MLLLGSVIAPPEPIQAQDENVLSQKAAGYQIEVVPPAGDLKPGQPGLFTFMIESTENSMRLAYTTFGVEFSQAGKIIFESRHLQTDEKGQAQLVILFPVEANYRLGVIFEVAGQEQRVDFAFPVGQPNRIRQPWEEALAWPVAIAGFIGLALGWLIRGGQKQL